MGIPSFTKYLEYRSEQYFEKYKLYNCSLVIDGHNLCNKLYNWQYSYWKTGFSPYCYGGDYDKYAEIVKRFFLMLRKCNVTPYIILDGCSGNDTVSLVKQRLNEKAKINSKITPTSDHRTYAIGAVALRYAFRDVIVELGLKAYTSTRDANRQIASLAKHLNCPVLSADSDFFISSALFIPFSSIDCKIKEINDYPYKCVSCKIYKIENLINALNRRPDMHYLLPVLLGNNLFSTDILNSFFKRVRIIGGRQKKIELIFQWLKKQSTLETAINEIITSFVNKEKKCSILKIIKSTIMRYPPISITYMLEHFDMETSKQVFETLFNFNKVEEALGLKVEETNNDEIQVAELFEKKFTECQYPAFFLDMLMKNRYFIWPNIEDCSQPDANTIGYNIMSAIHNILVQTDKKRLTVLRRNSKIELEKFLLPAYKDPLPSIEEIDYLRLEGKQDLIFKILETNPNFCEIFESFPKEWHLFILSLKYSITKSQFTTSFIYSLISSFLILNYVDSKLKIFYRSDVDLQNFLKVSQNFDQAVGEKSKFSTISAEDSLVFMKKVIIYFDMDSKENAETYNREIVHSIAEFQCVFLHLKYLNALLNYPFEDAFMYKTFDGTFIYNMAKNLEAETNLKNYFAKFLEDCPSIYCVLIYVIELFEKHSIL